MLAVSAFVVLVGLTGMMIAIMTSLQERRREMAILRAVGARPVHIFAMIVGEAAFVTTAGVTLGLAVFYGLLLIAGPVISSYFGLFITLGLPSMNEIGVIVIMCLVGVIIGCIPGYQIYRYSLADGMTIKV